MEIRRIRFTLVAAALVGAMAAASVFAESDASAKSGYDSAYGFERTWNAGMRLVRVDLGLKITEKDDSAGYLLFEYKSPESGKPCPGSMEFIRSAKDGSVHVVVQITQMPGYHEQVLVEQLARKLRNEYGEPPRRPPPPRDPRPSDAGTLSDAEAP